MELKSTVPFYTIAQAVEVLNEKDDKFYSELLQKALM